MPEQSRADLRKQRSHRIKQKIYNTAMDLFELHGFDNVKIKDICEKADVSIGSFYHFFPSKEHLLLAHAGASDDYFDALSEQVAFPTAAQTLQQLVAHKVGFIAHSGVSACQKTFVASINNNESSSFSIERKAYQKMMQSLTQGIDNHEFRSDINPTQITSLMRFALGGVLLYWCLEDGDFDIYNASEEQMDVLLQLIKQLPETTPEIENP